VQEIPLEWIPARRRLRKYDYAWSAVQSARNWAADVVYTRLPQAAALSASSGQATILEIHDIPRGFAGSRLFKRFLRSNGALRLVVISKILAADLNDNFGAPESPPFTHVIPDGVDLGRYSDLPGPAQSRSELLPLLQTGSKSIGARFFPDRFTAGYTGHLYPGRGMDLILKLAKRSPEMNFLVVGGEPQDVSRIAGKVKERGLENVTLVGFIPNADLPKYQAACDVLLMPYQQQVSASSGGDIARYLSPMKLFEYLACGRAICSSDLPVLREVLSDEIAILLPPDDIDSWDSALQRLRNDTELRMKLAKNALDAAALYSWESRAQKVLAGL
jgi:glycosyltransferase involved in cell wall biosynthesis